MTLSKSSWYGIGSTLSYPVLYNLARRTSALVQKLPLCGVDYADRKPLKSFRHFWKFFLIYIDRFTYNCENCYSCLRLNCLISLFLTAVVNRCWPKAVKFLEKWNFFFPQMRSRELFVFCPGKSFPLNWQALNKLLALIVWNRTNAQTKVPLLGWKKTVKLTRIRNLYRNGVSLALVIDCNSVFRYHRYFG